MKSYKVKAILEVEYEIPMGKADSRKDAVEVAKGYLLEKIANKNVAYDELKAKIVA
jgi:hypothetical protein